MVDTLDPHSEYLESKDNEELEEDLDGEYGGIGVEVEMHKGAYSVISPIPGSPGTRPASAWVTRSRPSTARPSSRASPWTTSWTSSAASRTPT
jgi:hypothetical protein